RRTPARRDAGRTGQARHAGRRDRQGQHSGRPGGRPRPHQPQPEGTQRMSSNGSRVIGLGHYQPEKVLTNDDLAKIVDTNDEWIQSRVGIRERRIAEKESVADMATEAAEAALKSSGLSAEDIDLIVVATCTAIDRVPNTACRVAERLHV